jgi:MATE family multidrug resistance protein
LGYLLAFSFGMGAAGMWVGFIAGLTFASIFLIIRFFRRSRSEAVTIPMQQASAVG